jgi:membrane protease YdiL (CAAX protease family)
MSGPASPTGLSRIGAGEGRLLTVSVAAVTGAIALLLMRPSPAIGLIRSPAVLGAAYVVILGVGSLISSAASRTAAVARSGPSAGVLGTGLAAVVIARVVVAPAPPIRTTIATTALSVLAAVAEEALFRGAAFRLLERRGAALAVAGSTLVFALIHVPAYGWPAFPVDLGAGLLFSWQRLATGRWSVPAATHAAANLLAVMR